MRREVSHIFCGSQAWIYVFPCFSSNGSPYGGMKPTEAVRAFDDTKRSRFVVHRRAGRIQRKTSVRYKSEHRYYALIAANRLAEALSACPASKLAKFKFSR